MDYIIKKSLFGNKLVDMSGNSFKTDGKVKVKMLGDSTFVFVDKNNNKLTSPCVGIEKKYNGNRVVLLKLENNSFCFFDKTTGTVSQEFIECSDYYAYGVDGKVYKHNVYNGIVLEDTGYECVKDKENNLKIVNNSYENVIYDPKTNKYAFISDVERKINSNSFVFDSQNIEKIKNLGSLKFYKDDKSIKGLNYRNELNIELPLNTEIIDIKEIRNRDGEVFDPNIFIAKNEDGLKIFTKDGNCYKIYETKNENIEIKKFDDLFIIIKDNDKYNIVGMFDNQLRCAKFDAIKRANTEVYGNKGLLVVKKNGKVGLIEYTKSEYDSYRKNGTNVAFEQILDTQFDDILDEVSSVVNNRFVVKKDDKWGIVDRQGNIIVDFQYELNSNIIDIVKDWKRGAHFVDKDGNSVILTGQLDDKMVVTEEEWVEEIKEDYKKQKSADIRKEIRSKEDVISKIKREDEEAIEEAEDGYVYKVASAFGLGTIMRKPIVGAAAYLYVKSKTNEEIRDAERQKQSHKAVIDELEKSINELTKEQGSIQKETCKKYSQLSAEVKSIREKYSRQRNENFNSNSDIKSI